MVWEKQQDLRLGGTYGHLKSPEPRTADEKRYDEYIKIYRTDSGTANYILDDVRSGRDTFTGSSKKVIGIVKRKMLSNIPSVLFIIFVQNLGIYPSKLCDPTGGHLFQRDSDHDITSYWLKNVRMRVPTIFDFTVMLLAVAGAFVLLKRKSLFGYLSVLIFVYTLLFSITIAVSDPRYRAVVDIIIILMAAYSLDLIILRLAKVRSSHNNRSHFRVRSTNSKGTD